MKVKNFCRGVLAKIKGGALKVHGKYRAKFPKKMPKLAPDYILIQLFDYLLNDVLSTDVQKAWICVPDTMYNLGNSGNCKRRNTA